MRIFATGLAMLFAGSAFAGSAVPAAGIFADVEVEDPYVVVATYDVNIPNGISTYEFALPETFEGGNVSFWYEESQFCRGFGVDNVSFITEGEDGQTISSSANLFNGVYHYSAPAGAAWARVDLSTNALFGQSCRLHIRQATFAVPALVTLLGRATATCESDPDANEICTFQIRRLDTDAHSDYSVSEEDFYAFGLNSGAIFQIRGHVMIDAETAAETLKILSARYIMD